MIFSASKHDALAGSRFGWGLVKDVELAKSMNDVNEAIVYTMPEDAVLRTYNTMSSILSKCTMGGSGVLYSFHHSNCDVQRFGARIMACGNPNSRFCLYVYSSFY